MDLSVVIAAREDEAGPEAALNIAAVADELGYHELWVGEGPTWDAFVLATAVGLATDQGAITVGPVSVSVRDPASISRGAASVTAVTGRRVGVALGTSSVRVVEKLHGRSRVRAAAALADSARAIRALIDTSVEERHVGDEDADFLRRLASPTGPLTVAAFGDRAIAVAAEHADRMLLDIVSPAQVTEPRAKLEAASRGGRPTPRLAAWLPAAVDPDEVSRHQVLRSIVGYLTVVGYREMFAAAGFGEAVGAAQAGADQDTLVGILPAEAAAIVGLVGDKETVEKRLDCYASAGLDEIAVVPATGGDPGGNEHCAPCAR